MGEPITLPGAIGDLVLARRGAPIVWRPPLTSSIRMQGAPTVRHGVVVDDDGAFGPRIVAGFQADPWRDASIEYLPLSDVDVDLRAEGGPDIAARWLIARLGLPSTTCPCWVRHTSPGTLWWSIGWQLLLSECEPKHNLWRRVPGFAGIDRNNPDADLLALRAACLHFGVPEVSRG